jgi:hypothetical protein
VVEVEVVELEVEEGGGEAGGDVFGAVAGWLLVCFVVKGVRRKALLVVPELAGDPEVFSFQARLL